MKKRSTILLACAGLVVLAFAAFNLPRLASPGQPVLADTEPVNKKPAIVATGRGEVSVKPDIAYLNLGVTTSDASSEKAAKENSDKMNTILAKLKEAGIPADKVNTSSYTIQPRYDYDTGKPVFKGYEVTNTVSVTVEDLTKVGGVHDQAVSAGANQVNSIAFDLKDRAAAQNSALELAVKDAKSKADAMAKGAAISQTLTPGVLTEISYSMPMRQNLDAVKEAAALGTPIVANELTVSASVTAEYWFGN